jgi:hypothetical protein
VHFSADLVPGTPGAPFDILECHLHARRRYGNLRDGGGHGCRQTPSAS